MNGTYFVLHLLKQYVPLIDSCFHADKQQSFFWAASSLGGPTMGDSRL